MAAYVLVGRELVKIAEAATAAAPGAREVKVSPGDVTTGPQGKVTIAFATLNEIDADMDVTLPGAFVPTDVVLSAWNHASWQPSFLPIGRGTIREEGNRGVFRGRIILATQAGRETFEVLRELRELSQFSYGYTIAESDRGSFRGRMVRFLRKLDVFEVSPVLRAAGVRTGLIELSGLDPLSIEVANVAGANARALRAASGHAGKRTQVGTHRGKPVYSVGQK